MKTKKLLIIALALTLCIGLSACGEKDIDKTMSDLSQEQKEEEESIDLATCVTGIRDRVVEMNSKPDYMDGIKFDKKYVKEVTVDASKVDITKEGTYPLVYTIVGVKNDDDKDAPSKKVTKKVTVEVKETLTEEDKVTEDKKHEEAEQAKPTPKPEQPSDNTGNSGSNKPSGGGSNNNSGSNNSASKPNTGGSNNSSNSGNSGNKPAEHTHNYVTVVDKEAWTETKVIKEAWTETVVDKAAWTETKKVAVGVIDGYGNHFNSPQEYTAAHKAYALAVAQGKADGMTPISAGFDYVYETQTIQHPAETHPVNHPAETQTINHPAVTHKECSCGARK